MKQVVALLVMGLSSVAFGTTKAYDVVPYGNCVAEIVTVPNGGVTQFCRNTLDSLTTASIWVGDTLSGQTYVVYVYDSITGLPVAHNPGFPAHQCWAWLDFPLTKDAQPVRGRTYKVV